RLGGLGHLAGDAAMVGAWVHLDPAEPGCGDPRARRHQAHGACLHPRKSAPCLSRPRPRAEIRRDGLSRSTRQGGDALMTRIVRRILGIGFDGKPIYAPKHAHSLLLAAAGGGKTTCGAVPWLQSLIADDSRAIVVTDSKEGEVA